MIALLLVRVPAIPLPGYSLCLQAVLFATGLIATKVATVYGRGMRYEWGQQMDMSIDP